MRFTDKEVKKIVNFNKPNFTEGEICNVVYAPTTIDVLGLKVNEFQ